MNWTPLLIWVVVVGALFFFFWQKGYIDRLAKYVGETREEMKKCQWPTRDELWQSTVLIFLIIGFLGLFTLVADFVILGAVRILMAVGA